MSKSFALGLVAIGLSACVVHDDRQDAVGTTTDALTSLVVEAEGATGIGPVFSEPDPTASNGQRLLVGPRRVATKPFTSTGPLVGGIVRVRSGCAAADEFSVTVDGRTLQLQRAAPPLAWTDVRFFGPNFASGDHTLGFQNRGMSGCPIWFDRVTFDIADPPPPLPPPVVVEGEAAVGAGIVVSDPLASGGQYRHLYGGPIASASFSTAGALASAKLRGRVSDSCGATGTLRIFIDGIPRGDVAIAPGPFWREVPFFVPPFAAGPHTVGFVTWQSACPVDIDAISFQTN
jgi:hypothetical protein